MPGALIVGDLMVVVSGGVERMPASGENVLLSTPTVHVSGVGANVGLNLRSLGADVAIASAVGDDPPGDRMLVELGAGGIDVRFVERRPGVPSGSMVVIVEPSGERTMIGTRGAAERFDLDPAQVLDACRPGWVHISGYVLIDPAMERRCEALVAEAERRGVPTSVDLEGIAATGRRTTLDRATVLCNRHEFAAYFGSPEPSSDLGMGRRAPLVLKAGRDGCVLVDGGAVVNVPVDRVDEPVDTTGAGDAFDAAFIAARLAGHDAVTACRWGNLAGATKAGHAGPRVRLDPRRIHDRATD